MSGAEGPYHTGGIPPPPPLNFKFMGLPLLHVVRLPSMSGLVLDSGPSLF